MKGDGFLTGLRVFLVLVLALTGYEALQSWGQAYQWRMGDWMINYSSGFVRRGFSGELLLGFWHLTRVPPTLALTLFQLACYALFFLFSFRLIAEAEQPRRYALLVFSPVLFLFQIYDPHGGFRKEILVYPLLAWLVWMQRRHGRIPAAVTLLVAGLVFPALVLSHEMLVIVWPLVLIALLWNAPQPRRRPLLAALLSLPSALAVLAALHGSHADPQQVRAICRSWGPYASPECLSDGAIAFLASDARLGFGQVLQAVAGQRYLVVYTIVAGLSVLCFWPIRGAMAAVCAGWWHRLLVGATLLGTFALCAVAIDWGRFLDMDLIALFLLSFLPAVEPAKQGTPRPAHGMLRMLPGRARLGMLFVFNTLWHIPHVGLNFFLGYTISRALLGLH